MKNNKITMLISVFLAFVISFTVINIQEKKILHKDIELAEEYFMESNYDKAVEKYNNILKKDKNNPLWYVKLAEVYSVNGDLDNSRKYIDYVKKLNYKNDEEIFNYVIFTEFMNKDYEKALQDGEEAVKKYPKSNKIIKTMFSIYMANNKMGEAKNIIKNYVVQKDSSYDYAEYARMLLISGNIDEGYNKLEEAFDINIDEIKIYDAIAEICIYNYNDFLQKASEVYEKNPDNKFYAMCLAKVYSLTYDTCDKAINILNNVKLNTDSLEIKLLKLSCYENKKDYDNSQKIIDELLSKNGDDYRVSHAIGWYYLQKGDNDEALRYCNMSIKQNKDYCDNYGYLMPQILSASGNNKNEKPYFRRALYIEPYNYNIMLSAADYYYNSENNVKEALQFYNFAQLLNPYETDIKYKMALIYINQDKTSEAINELKQCTKINAQIPDYYRALGSIYVLKGDYKNAITNIRSAYNLDNNDSLTLNNLGIYYFIAEENVEKGYKTMLKAYQSLKLKQSYDENTIKVITQNFKKTRDIYDIYINAKSETIKIPELTLFY